MALDSTQPKVGAIAQVAVLAIVTLFATREALVAYFDSVARAEQYRKWGSLPADALDSLRAEEARQLSSGAMPIDKAMQAMAAKGRMGASPDIAPASSAPKDLAPLEGWSQMPAQVPVEMSAAPPSSAAPVPSDDGGAAVSTRSDAGPAVRTMPDAGPPRPGHRP